MRLLIISDPHFAGIAERARRGWERRAIPGRAQRLFATLYRRFFWLADPTGHNHLLDDFLRVSGEADWVVANGDYSCDSAFIGVADDPAFASAQECLGKLRRCLGRRLLATLGDHELGKMSLFGGVGGPRLASWERCVDGLKLEPVWTQGIGKVTLVGTTSSLLALDAFRPELIPEEIPAWERLRREHLLGVRAAFESADGDGRFVLFCHDPTALPWLAREPWMGRFLARIDYTIIGHLHSELVLRTSRMLAGMPELGFLGNTARRLSGALRRGRDWRSFRIALCPSLAGIELLKDGGYLELQLDPEGREPTQLIRHHLPWSVQPPAEREPRGSKTSA